MSIRKKPIQNSRRPTTGAASRIYSRENVGRYSERARQRRTRKRVRRGILCGVVGVLLVGVVAAGAWFTSIMSRLNDSSIITSALQQILVILFELLVFLVYFLDDLSFLQHDLILFETSLQIYLCLFKKED